MNMAIDTHIKFAGIEGESTHVDHKGEIAVLSWSWGLSATAGAGGGGGGGAGKATPRELNFTHLYDKASPALAKTAASLKHVPTAVLTARKAGEGQKDFLMVAMKDVLITSVSASGGETDLAESVALTYGDIEFSYRPQDSKGGLGGEVKFDWNVKTGQVT
jgi:type VI secretion system secreted protein Hcp